MAECAVVAAIVGNGGSQLVLVEVSVLSRYCIKNLTHKQIKINLIMILYCMEISCQKRKLHWSHVYIASSSDPFLLSVCNIEKL